MTTYTWSAEDRLKEVRLPGGGIVTSTYRPDGLRHSREDAAGLQRLVWDGDEVLSVEGAAPQLFVRGVDLARAEGAGIDRTYHLDALGTTEALTGGSQAVETRYSLDAWGNVVSGSASGNPYVYHGGLGYWREADLGLEYVRARWLDPDTGSWLSVDPVSTEPRYSYALNQPTRQVDPSGRQSGYIDYGNPAAHAFGALQLGLGELWERFTGAGIDAQGGVFYRTAIATLRARSPELRLLTDAHQKQVEEALLTAYRKARAGAPQWLQKIAPPERANSRAFGLYLEGLLLGALEQLAYIMIAWGAQVFGSGALLILALIGLLGYILTHGTGGSLLDLVLQPIKADLERLTRAGDLPPFMAGYTAGHLLLGVAFLVLIGVWLARGGAQVARQAGPSVGGALSLLARVIRGDDAARQEVSQALKGIVPRIAEKGHETSERVSKELKDLWEALQAWPQRFKGGLTGLPERVFAGLRRGVRELLRRIRKGAVRVTGTPDTADEVPQAIRFGEYDGGGQFEFSSQRTPQGVEGIWRPDREPGEQIWVSLKSMRTGRLLNIARELRENLNQIRAAGTYPAVVYAEPINHDAFVLADFARNGPIFKAIIQEGIVSRIVLRAKGGWFVEITPEKVIVR